jgi:HAD superfamily hydrolase (TIGR01549 family)
MKMDIEAIVFDFDGILAESVDVKGQAFYELYEDAGQDIQNKVLNFHNANGGVSRYDKIRYYEQTLCGRTLSEESVQQRAARFSQIVEQRVIDSDWVEGAKDFLDTHSKSIPFYIASATPENELKRITDRRSMSHYFRGIFGTPKKKSDNLQSVIEDNGHMADRVLMIGDAITDFEAARANGTQFVGRRIKGKENPFPSGTLIIDDLRALSSVLKLLS